jgi:CRISPR system Cascade subunit CasE
VLVQAAVPPDWSGLLSGYLAAEAPGENPDCKEVGTLYAGLRPGQELRFRLLANPTKRIAKARTPDEEHMVGKRVELQREEDQLAWLERKGENGGFELLTVRASPGGSSVSDESRSPVANVRTVPNDKVRGGPKSAQLTFGSVLFDGVLRVTDAGRLLETIQAGIGSGKAYGFGLLSIAPA